jgi:hypothetical protein
MNSDGSLSRHSAAAFRWHLMKGRGTMWDMDEPEGNIVSLSWVKAAAKY